MTLIWLEYLYIKKTETSFNHIMARLKYYKYESFKTHQLHIVYFHRCNVSRLYNHHPNVETWHEYGCNIFILKYRHHLSTIFWCVSKLKYGCRIIVLKHRKHFTTIFWCVSLMSTDNRQQFETHQLHRVYFSYFK